MEHPNSDQVERDFSARQAYAQAQQEEVTEERDLHPNSQKSILSMKSLSGELLGKTHCLSVHLMLLRSQYSTVPTDDIEDP